jgi:putative tryptophan/tyrosine transport system substrate-binding protein
VRRRDFTTGLLLTAAFRSVWAQTSAKQNRIAIVIPAGPVTGISDTGVRAWQAFFAELRRLGDIEGKNLTIERYSGEGRPEGYADLAREVVSRNPDLIVAANDATAKAVRAATGTIPIVWIGGDPIQAGFATNLAHPGGNITGVTVYAGVEIWGKRLQILKEAVPSAFKAAYLTTRVSQAAEGQQLREAGQRLQISVIELPLEEVTSTAIQGAFAEIAQQQSQAIIVNSNSLLFPYRQLIVELAEKSRLPALYPWREYVEAGGLMAYASDNRELWRRMADDVHEILNGAKPGDIPVYQPTKFEFLINQKASKALDLTIPPSLLALADEVIE